jgi:type II restriction enzyme
MVYDFLPDGEFTNNEVYAYKSVFKQKYPDNQNIEAKIRQQLQTLRDLGFVEHLGKARWRKL